MFMRRNGARDAARDCAAFNKGQRGRADVKDPRRRGKKKNTQHDKKAASRGVPPIGRAANRLQLQDRLSKPGCFHYPRPVPPPAKGGGTGRKKRGFCRAISPSALQRAWKIAAHPGARPSRSSAACG